MHFVQKLNKRTGKRKNKIDIFVEYNQNKTQNKC